MDRFTLVVQNISADSEELRRKLFQNELAAPKETELRRNLTRNRNALHDIVLECIDQVDADLYALQRAPAAGAGRACYTGFATKEEGRCRYGREEDDYEVKKLWEEAFPWAKYESGYWMEKTILFGGEEILIINYHCAYLYATQLRYLLLKRLESPQLQDQYVIVTGDLQAVHRFPTELIKYENDKFYLEILKRGYKDPERIQGEINGELGIFYRSRKWQSVFQKNSGLVISDKLAQKCAQGDWKLEAEILDRERSGRLSYSDYLGLKLTLTEEVK